MNPPIPGLRPLWNKSNSVAKVALVVQPGDTMFVSDNLAAQLAADRQPFEEGIALTAVDSAPDSLEATDPSPKRRGRKGSED